MIEEERAAIRAMKKMPGYSLLESWVNKKIKEASYINCIPLGKTDVEIVQFLRMQQARRDVYASVLDFFKEGDKDGRRDAHRNRRRDTSVAS